MMPAPTLLLLHGALGTKSSFAKIEKFLDKDFKIHSLDFSGHGEETVEEGERFSIDLFSKNVLDYLNKNNIDIINIFGYSMGGYVALHLCTTHPERIEKAFTLGTKINWTKESSEKEIKMLDAEKMLQKIPAFTEEIQRRHTKTNWRTMLKKTAEMMIDLGNNNLLSEQMLSTIHHEIRLGIGDKDTMAGLEDTINAYKHLKNGQLEVFPNTEHPLGKINVERIANAIKEFFIEENN